MQQPPDSRVRLRPISGTEDDARIVQKIYDAAPGYWPMTDDQSGKTGDAAKTFAILPEGSARDDKHMFLIESDGLAIGFIDVIRNYPNTATAYVGLFIIAETHHRTGVGRAAYAGLEREFADWNGIERVRLAVFETNQPALGFWAAMGFHPIGERADHEIGDGCLECLLFEKRFAAGHDR